MVYNSIVILNVIYVQHYSWQVLFELGHIPYFKILGLPLPPLQMTH